MKGQWRGTYTGASDGDIVVEVDEYSDHFAGFAYLYSENPQIPATLAIIRTSDKASRCDFTAPLHALNPATFEPVPWAQIQQTFPGVELPERADVRCEWTDDTLQLNWTTRTGAGSELHQGGAQIERASADRPSDCVPLDVQTWEDFKSYATSLEPARYIFRGQSKPWRLRTSFHRTGRADTRRYANEDIPTLFRHLSVRMQHVYDVSKPAENAAFYNLIQHHGYPTPLLDWTFSPFVGAFFAYREVSRGEAASATDARKVRVFVFDKKRWCSDWSMVHSIATRRPHFSILEALAIGNERMIPQQALSSFTNVDDVEQYIRNKGEGREPYLQVIDLPASERNQVMRELSLMGITAGSLFPGVDGTCEEIRERLFGL